MNCQKKTTQSGKQNSYHTIISSVFGMLIILLASVQVLETRGCFWKANPRFYIDNIDKSILIISVIIPRTSDQNYTY